MRCPNCPDRNLKPALTRQGVEVDRCGKCGGIWLDRGEIFLFVKGRKKLLAEKIERAIERRTLSSRLSPRTGKPMVIFGILGEPAIDLCETSGGVWLDAGELGVVLDQPPRVRLDLDPTAVEAAPAKRASAALGRALLPLPNLFLRSTLTLAFLYAILGAVLIPLGEFLEVGLEAAVLAGVLVVVAQFALGPWLMDLELRWLFKTKWLSEGELPEHLRAFVAKVAAERNIKFPRFGLILDDAPQAFTYGHTPSNARIVISRGTLNLLRPEEVEAVVAHELGHVVHWDMALMTAAYLVPLLLYYVYRSLTRVARNIKGRKSGQAKAAVLLAAVAVYVAYVISQYVVLGFSRTREYHADRFAGEATGHPAHLASALVKIAYGLAGRAGRKEAASEQEETAGARSPSLEALGAMGIFDAGYARGLAIASHGGGAHVAGAVDRENLKGAMRWDLWSPWAKWYEFHSTHPLAANRLLHLSDQSAHMGQAPYVAFDEVQPESYWDEFAVDLVFHLVPAAAWAFAGVTAILCYAGGAVAEGAWVLLPAALVMLGAAELLHLGFSYRSDFFPAMSVAALLKRVKVSSVRPVPCTVEGTVIGRGVPGYILSEDFVLRDDTGLVFLDYSQPLAIWEVMFGLLKAGEYIGREVVVEGWYRRAPVPYVEVKTIQLAGKIRRSWVPILKRWTAFAFMAAGALLLAYQMFWQAPPRGL